MNQASFLVKKSLPGPQGKMEFPTQPFWPLFLASLGLLSLLKPFLSLLKYFYVTFFRPPKNLEKYGSWALITGSTDGIGKSLAFQLAKTGLNLILLGRNHNKLKQVLNEIQVQCPDTKIKTMVVDFSKEVKVEEIKKMIKGLDVGVLINNVGVTYDQATFFHQVEEAMWMNLVKVNILGTSVVTRAVVEGMVKRKRGAIVNIGSGAAIVVPSHPLYAVYAATKAYIDQFSRSMFIEYKNMGIDVQCQVPLYVVTNMTSRVASIHKPSIFVPSPDAYAKASVRLIGYESRCTPYWAHYLQWCFIQLVPDYLLDAWRLSIGIRRMELLNKPL